MNGSSVPKKTALLVLGLTALAILSASPAQAINVIDLVEKAPGNGCEHEIVSVGCTYYSEYCDPEEYNHQYPEGDPQGCMKRFQREYCEVMIQGHCLVGRGGNGIYLPPIPPLSDLF